MRRDEQIRVIKGLMHHLDTDTNVDAGCQLKNPVSAYTDPERAGREWQEFFLDYPQVVGLSVELPENGSFFTNHDLGKPILCTRDSEGRFRAFLNVCRHRGTVVETAARGKKKLFTCPFHAWGYDASGRLVSVPKEGHFGEVDRSCHSLVDLPAVEKHGILWVHPDPAGVIDVDQLLGPALSDELGAWNFDKCTYHVSTTFPHACNWKFAVDTFGETYHFDTLHRDTLNLNFYGNAQMYDTYERNHRMSLCIRPIDRMRNEPEDTWHVLRGSLPVYYLYPNIQLIVGAEGPTLVRIYPDADNPHESKSQISWYVFPDETRDALGPVFGEYMESLTLSQRMEGFAAVIQAEDYVAAASNHVGALSGAQEHIIFGRNEPALHHYHKTYNAALGLPAPEKA